MTDTEPGDRPAAVNRPLTDDERALIMELATWTVAEQTGVSRKAAADALNDFSEKSGLHLEYDAHDAYIKTIEHGHVIVHATREWLAFYASNSDEEIDLDKQRWRPGGGLGLTWFKAPRREEDTE